MTKQTAEELQAQRAQLIASTGMTETVLRERAAAFQLYPEHPEAWSAVEGIDYLLNGDEGSADLDEARALAARWEGKYFELVEKYTPLAAQAVAVRRWLPVLRRAVEALPAKCLYHGDPTPSTGGWRWSEACCDTGMPARRRALAEEALNALMEEATV
ncbi:hypothetical protein [Streptomyces sp. NPDC059783]|uniref:hypothetical protein n=1 Tax=Streptomyces sp. NPDC059783 TaxID=3346944 RepID=UPI00364D5A24